MTIKKKVYLNFFPNSIIVFTSDVYFIISSFFVKALTNAKSVTARVLTKEEQAQNYCQIGSTGLALDAMAKWIEKSHNLHYY